jgi:hypothetical protein
MRTLPGVLRTSSPNPQHRSLFTVYAPGASGVHERSDSRRTSPLQLSLATYCSPGATLIDVVGSKQNPGLPPPTSLPLTSNTWNAGEHASGETIWAWLETFVAVTTIKKLSPTCAALGSMVVANAKAPASGATSVRQAAVSKMAQIPAT